MVERVAEGVIPFAPGVAEDLQKELQMWPALALPVMSEGGVRFLQHSLTRALSLGPAAEDMFGDWSETSNMDPVTMSRWVAHLMCVGTEGGLWLD